MVIRAVQAQPMALDAVDDFDASHDLRYFLRT